MFFSCKYQACQRNDPEISRLREKAFSGGFHLDYLGNIQKTGRAPRYSIRSGQWRINLHPETGYISYHGTGWPHLELRCGWTISDVVDLLWKISHGKIRARFPTDTAPRKTPKKSPKKKKRPSSRARVQTPRPVPSAQRVDYYKYIASSAWKNRRNRAMESVGRRCEICRSDRDLHVHHLSYKNLGNERPEDLQVLCADCHCNTHEGEKPWIMDSLTREYLSMFR